MRRAAASAPKGPTTYSLWLIRLLLLQPIFLTAVSASSIGHVAHKRTTFFRSSRELRDNDVCSLKCRRPGSSPSALITDPILPECRLGSSIKEKTVECYSKLNGGCNFGVFSATDCSDTGTGDAGAQPTSAAPQTTKPPESEAPTPAPSPAPSPSKGETERTQEKPQESASNPSPPITSASPPADNSTSSNLQSDKKDESSGHRGLWLALGIASYVLLALILLVAAVVIWRRRHRRKREEGANVDKLIDGSPLSRNGEETALDCVQLNGPSKRHADPTNHDKSKAFATPPALWYEAQHSSADDETHRSQQPADVAALCLPPTHGASDDEDDPKEMQQTVKGGTDVDLDEFGRSRVGSIASTVDIDAYSSRNDAKFIKLEDKDVSLPTDSTVNYSASTLADRITLLRQLQRQQSSEDMLVNKEDGDKKTSFAWRAERISESNSIEL